VEGEFRVNDVTAGDQADPSVAIGASGVFVVTWSSQGQDARKSWGVYARRYDASGPGEEFRVNAATAGDQLNPSVAMNHLGEFVVAWSSKGQDGDGWGVYARRYDATGRAQVEGEFRVNDVTAGDQADPSVAIGASGVFVVTWSSQGQDARKSWGVYARRYDASGPGEEFRVNDTTDGDQRYSSVAMDEVGNFFITWSSDQRGHAGWGVYGRQYLADGRVRGEEMRIDTTTFKDQMHSTVAVDEYGHAVVVWSGGGVGDRSGVFMQRLDLTHTDIADGVIDDFEPEGVDHDHDAQEPHTRTHSPEPDLDLISDVASTVAGRDSLAGRNRSQGRRGSPWWRAGRRLGGRRGS
jgi:hypothetical protein